MPFPIVAAIAGAATIGSAILGNNAAKKAADAQLKASREANELQRYMYDTSRSDMADYRDVGRNALYAYSDALGLPRTAEYLPAPTVEQVAATPQIIGYKPGGRGSRTPIYGEVIPKEKTAQAATTAATPPRQTNVLDTLRATPGYQFQMGEGLKAVDRGAAAKGNFGSGSYMKDLLRFSQGLADNTYGEYMNRLGVLSGIGQSQTNALANLGQNYATNAGNNINAAGSARASGYIGQANTLMNTGNALANLYANNQLYGGSSGTGSPGVAIGQMPSNIAGYYQR